MADSEEGRGGCFSHDQHRPTAIPAAREKYRRAVAAADILNLLTYWLLGPFYVAMHSGPLCHALSLLLSLSL